MDQNQPDLTAASDMFERSSKSYRVNHGVPQGSVLGQLVVFCCGFNVMLMTPSCTRPGPVDSLNSDVKTWTEEDFLQLNQEKRSSQREELSAHLSESFDPDLRSEQHVRTGFYRLQNSTVSLSNTITGFYFLQNPSLWCSTSCFLICVRLRPLIDWLIDWLICKRQLVFTKKR